MDLSVQPESVTGFLCTGVGRVRCFRCDRRSILSDGRAIISTSSMRRCKVSSGSERGPLNYPVGDHGIAIMQGRELLVIESDTAPLHTLIASLLDAAENVCFG